MSQPGALSRTVLAICWLLLGLGMIAVPLWLGLTRGAAILNGHPALLGAGIASGLLGCLALAWSVASLTIGDRQDREGDSQHPARRTPAQLERRARLRIGLAVPALPLCAALVGALAYARPLPATSPAIAALRSEQGVRIAERLSWYELVPTGQDKAGKALRPTTGLVFVPGARVDSRAYAALLRPLAAAGYLVAVLKEPFGFSVAQPDHAETVIRLHPEIKSWAVGGHSLGGVTAAAFADRHPPVKGLVLWASYPSQALTRTDLAVLSVSGSSDGLTTPADLEASKAKLPAGTRFLVIDGAVHSTFGDYGEQAGDGIPVGDRAAQQAQISAATQELLASIAPAPKSPPPKKK